MYHFIIGTKAQLIKMAPVMKEMMRREVPFHFIDSGQHAKTTEGLRRIFKLPAPDVSLRQSGEDITRIGSALLFYIKLLFMALLRRSYVREFIFKNDTGICLIHGDTLTTLIGLHLAKSAGLKTAHIESGLRSRRLFDPFPEEIIRIWCMRHADILFTPSEEAEKNLSDMKVSGKIVCIPGNTVIDAVRLVNKQQQESDTDSPYAIATCHRFETISKYKRLSQVVDMLNKLSERMLVKFVVHQPTKNALISSKLIESLSSNIQLLDLVEYDAFIGLLLHSRCVITDGGSIQEECAYLNKPCLIIRKATERTDGIGSNAILWGFDNRALAQFFNIVERENFAIDSNNSESPSRLIVDALLSYSANA
jgi:UDP-N-acetylglucosamine 2-epimerase